MFNQLVGQYNRGLIGNVELLDELNSHIRDIGSVINTGLESDRFVWTYDTLRLNYSTRYRMLLEPYFHPTTYNGDRIAYHVHFI